MIINKLASAIKNDIIAGLSGYHSNLSISIEQLEDDIVDTRLSLINSLLQQGTLNILDLLTSINCIEVDCKDLERCNCNNTICGTPTAHFEIPQLINDFGISSIDYLGSTDRQTPFLFSTTTVVNRLHKYRKRGKDKPFVYIDTTPNENGMYDCFIFNAPLIKQVSITAIFKDPRQLELFQCCTDNMDDNYSALNALIKETITKQKVNYYRLLMNPVQPNKQTYRT